MSKNKEHRDKIKASKKKQEKEFLATIPFSESIFQELFDYLDEELETEPCEHNFNLTKKFLLSEGINFQEHIDFFIEHGGGCDCEILMNVEEVFPEPEYEQLLTVEKPVRRERITFLRYQDLEIDSIPTPWKLFRSEDDYEFQFGKNKDIKVKLVKDFKIENWNDDNYWQRQWELITGLEVNSEKEIIYDDLEGFERVTFKTQDWTPVLTWIRKKGKESWVLRFRTELSRFRGDISEFKKLLKEIK